VNVLTFYGASDDLVEIGLDGEGSGADEFNVYPDPRSDRGYAGTWVINDVIRVLAFYDGTWCFAPALVKDDALDGGKPIPEGYSIRGLTASFNDYSTFLVIESAEPLRVVKEGA
jgi:hypothetical protein